jgi:hypothetical protein
MGSINSLSSSYLQPVLNSAFQSAANFIGPPQPNPELTIGNNLSGISASSDNQQLSPFAQLMSTLQQLQQSDPTRYQQVTQQIATNLQSAAQTARKDGNSTAANQLDQLATDFTSASQSGQLPNIQDLAQAAGGGHHHHHHSHAASSDSGSDSGSSSSSSSSTANQSLSQLLAALQANVPQSDSLNPISIIQSTLSNAGISSSNS